jgi:hypothetical protein
MLSCIPASRRLRRGKITFSLRVKHLAATSKAFLTPLLHMLRDADIVEAWESGHVAGIPASLRLRCGKVTFGSAVKCPVATSKVSRKVYLTPLFSLGLLLITASSCAYSQSGKPEACADQKGSFDGTLPLRYAVVRGVTDNRLYFHP